MGRFHWHGIIISVKVPLLFLPNGSTISYLGTTSLPYSGYLRITSHSVLSVTAERLNLMVVIVPTPDSLGRLDQVYQFDTLSNSETNSRDGSIISLAINSPLRQRLYNRFCRQAGQVAILGQTARRSSILSDTRPLKSLDIASLPSTRDQPTVVSRATVNLPQLSSV